MDHGLGYQPMYFALNFQIIYLCILKIPTIITSFNTIYNKHEWVLFNK